MKDLINPIQYRGPGQCLKCGSLLMVADSEMNYLLINSDGTPSTVENKYYRCVGMCPNCGTNIDMINLGGKYIPVE